ncbi:MAG: hypothetical protein DMG41_12305 [Acidobacteria bacterium]|nr:MAG: hypothetical protein AUH13_05840 [Acidobacteria bacterium 13_2_20CM_58_27]PYT88139.1 MAG: hypothetical protein DMG41_12305 [Acidobacteriota bacterium]
MGICKKFLAAFAWLFLLVSVPTADPQTPSETCKSDDAANIVQMDERNERVFAVTSLDRINTVAKARKVLLSLQKTLKQCRPTWGNTWSVSFFSDRKYAGYKHDDNMKPFVRDGSWSRAYLGEYERVEGKLSLHPADPNRLKFLKVPLR